MKMRPIMIAVVAIALISVSISCSPAAWLRKTAVTETLIPSPQPEPTSREPSAIPTRSSEVLILEGNLASLYQRVNPGVVTIWRYDTIGTADEESFPTGQGSGFVIDLDGHIITNQHVIAGANEIEVDFPSGFKAWADLVGTDPDADLAVLKVDVPEEELVPLPFGNSDEVLVGDFVVAIGNPFGLSGTMTIGIVSAIGRTLESENPAPNGGVFAAGDIIQTDAAINPGNSGGPLINMHGEVIGVNRAIRSESFTLRGDIANSGVGFAIPINILRQVVPKIIETGSYDYPYLGIVSLNDDLWNLKIIEALGLPSNTTGAYITGIAPGGPAEEAGIRSGSQSTPIGIPAGGDLIIAIDGQPVRRFSELLSYIINHTHVSQVVILTVLREGEELDIPLTIGARP